MTLPTSSQSRRPYASARGLSTSSLGDEGIVLDVEADPVVPPADTAVSLGMVVNCRGARPTQSCNDFLGKMARSERFERPTLRFVV